MITPFSGLDAAPDFAADAFQQAPYPKAKNKAPLAPLDERGAITRTIDYLKRLAPEASPGNRSDTAFRVAAQVRQFGISQSMCFDLVAEHWESASVMDSAEDLLQCVENAYTYASAGWGALSGLAEFDDASKYLEPEKRPRLYSVPLSESVANALNTPLDPLVEEFLDRRAMSVMYGSSNAGKTFVALDIAYHVATGRPWLGRRTHRGLVVYVAAEGGYGIFRRAAALVERNKDLGPMHVVPCPVNLLDGRSDVKDLVEVVRAAETVENVECQMLVIDTMSRALAGGDENASTDVGAFVMNVDKIRAAIGCHMMIIHHSGKDAARGARGWSGLRAATDTEIEIVDNKIKVSKQRDMEPPKQDIHFRLKDVVLGKDAKGRTVKSAVVEAVTGSEFMKIEPNDAERKMLDALMAAAQEQLESSGNVGVLEDQEITTQTWDEVFLAQAEGESDRRQGARQRLRLRTQLASNGHVLRVGKGCWKLNT